uniref:Splicing factor 45 n=1 Tax=Panagrolaimus sp. JU765 TaxID=591449 RepID=A0AC34QV71_9BILA
MSLYDDIEPTIKRSRTTNDSQSEATYSAPERRYDGSKFGSQSMFAPRTLTTKKPTDNRTSRDSHSYGSTSYPSVPVATLQSVPSSFPQPTIIPIPTPQTAPPKPVEIDLEAIKSQIKQKRIALEQPSSALKGLFKNVPAPAAPLSAQNAYPPVLQARKVDISKLKEVNVVPAEIIRDDMEYLFDEVHIIDEYNPSKPNNYLDFMKSNNCNPAFGEEIDDSRLEKYIINDIINAQKDRPRKSPTPEPEEEKLAPSGPSVIANIMAKMGYTEGSGLGKHGQGMSSALRIEKKAGHGGRIVSEIDEVMMSVGLNPDEFTKPVTNMKGLFKNVPAPAAPLSAQNAYPPVLQARKVDISKLKEVNVVPAEIIRDDMEYLFDEVHIIDEYNPSKPNNYLDFMKSNNCNPAFGEEIDDSRLEKYIINDIISAQKDRPRKSPTPEPEEEKLAPSGPSVIANIMAKMGYTEGSGLGKHGQGMSSALRIEKKAGHGGRIVSEIDEVMMSVGLNPDEFTKPVTNVLLLRNMYTNADYPDDYESELQPELSQYGSIRRIYMHRQPNMEDPFEQVRIFVEYKNKASAVRAYADLNQRFFSQRPIRADFYPTERFALGRYNDHP